ncbi:Uncharacterised protein [Mycobacteroides abscessus subsp. abscessus]|nr:Uncharacterised protein [Mycobacteroides abscessus subsp. abscessus]
MQIQYREGVVERLASGEGRQPAALMTGRDDDLELGLAVHRRDFHQFDQAGRGPVGVDDEPPLPLVVDVAVVDVAQLHQRLERLVEPVRHDLGVIGQLMDERQVLPLERAQPDIHHSHNSAA